MAEPLHQEVGVFQEPEPNWGAAGEWKVLPRRVGFQYLQPRRLDPPPERSASIVYAFLIPRAP